VDRICSKFKRLEEVCDLSVGINTGSMKLEMMADRRIDSCYHPCVPGSGISRYGRCVTDGWIIYDPAVIKAAGSKGRALPPERFFRSDKILVVRTRNTALKRRIIATVDLDKCYNLNRLSNVLPKTGTDINTIIGIINSDLWNYLFLTRFFNYEIKPVYLKEAPVAANFDDQLSALVAQRLTYEDALRAATLPTRKAALKTLIASSEALIDDYVYALFGISVVEKAMIKARLAALPGKW